MPDQPANQDPSSNAAASRGELAVMQEQLLQERQARRVLECAARRLKWGLGIVVLALLLIGGGAWVWIDRLEKEKEARQAETTLAAEETLDRAQLLAGHQNWREARVFAKRAEALLETGVENRALQQRVRRLLADLDMVERLDHIRLAQATVKEGHFNLAGADPLYRQAFRQYGVDIAVLDAGQAAELLRASAIRDKLVAALDDWAFVSRSKDPEQSQARKRLLEIVRLADPDRLQNHLRVVLERNDVKVLKSLAKDGVLLHLPESTAVLFARVLARFDVGEAIKVLRQVQKRQPADFWINFELANFLTQVKPPRIHEAIAFYRVALALRPFSPGVHVNLGNAFAEMGERDQAIAEFRQAIRLQPDDAEGRKKLESLMKKKDKK